MILGITGAFGCGKSAVLRFFADKSWHIFDADSACKKLYTAKEPRVWEALKEIFGKTVFTKTGDLNREALASAIFNDPEKMKALTSFIYPLLTEKLESEICKCRQYKRNGAFEIPLLYEAGFEKYFDSVLAVWAPMALRKVRLYGRNFSDTDIDRRSKMQISAEEKLERADYAVINSGTLDDLNAQLNNLLPLLAK